MRLAQSPTVLALLVGSTLSQPLAAQQLPPPGQAQQALQQALQQNPALGDQIRDRLLASGLSPDEIRAKLQARGYPPNMLDAYLAPTGQAPSAGDQELAAIRALGLGLAAAVSLPTDTGLMRSRGDAVSPDSLATGNYVFGVDVFRRTTTQFLPTLAGPVPPDYRLGPGDHLVLILTGDVEAAYTLDVTREGFVLIPQVGQIFVANLTLDQLRDVLYARLGRAYSALKRGENATTRFDISVASVRVNQVYVVGEVKQPGAYQVSALGTVLTALYAAGGVTDRANLRQVEVRRQDKTATTFDLYDYLLRGDKRNDVRLETGDVVFVPLHGTRVQVTGAVLRPAIYELKAGETLADLLEVAGGFRSNAQLRRLSVYRILPAAQRGPGLFPRAVLDVPLVTAPVGDPPAADPGRAKGAALLSGVLVAPVPLSDGDSVVVDALPSLSGTLFVAISGMVNKEGRYPWRQGMTLRDLVLLARGPAIGAYLKEAEIARMPTDRSQGQLAQTIRVPMDSTYLFERDSAGRYFGPPGLPFPAGGAPDVPLQPYDNVLILRQPDFELPPTVYAAGEVRFPGSYALSSKGERLADLIDRAGGLTAQAYPDGIRFFRAVHAVGRIDVDLPKALAQRDSRYNIPLQPGDSLEVPQYEPSVKVSGAVNSPGSVLWQKGRDLDYYLNAAGGFTTRSDKAHVSVRYANGEVRTRRRWLLVTHDPTPAAGSEVFVPTQTTPGTSWITIAGAVSGILSSSIAIIVLLRQL